MSPDFDTLCQWLADANTGALAVHPSGVHGLYCGLVSAGSRPDAARLSDAIETSQDASCQISPDALLCCEQSVQTLEEGDFGFTLCLPDDEVSSLAERLQSLGAWCDGFLQGFAEIQQPLSAESEELLHDLTEISQIDAAAFENVVEADNDMEQDYDALTEFVRMAVISLFMDGNAPAREDAYQELTDELH